MKVRTVAYTMPTLDGVSPDDFIPYCARVSNPANQTNTGTSAKLLQYLVKNEHWSPFEMASMTLEIVTTRDIARQILRHRSFSFQEFSQRYAEVAAPMVPREARMQDAKNRQASLETADAHIKHEWIDLQSIVKESAERAYSEAIKMGIAKEVARAVLPEGMTESTLYMAGTLRSWMHYIALRTDEGTQKEHREIAALCGEELRKNFPNVAKAVWHVYV